jgi:hypothetical protein
MEAWIYLRVNVISTFPAAPAFTTALPVMIFSVGCCASI